MSKAYWNKVIQPEQKIKLLPEATTQCWLILPKKCSALDYQQGHQFSSGGGGGGCIIDWIFHSAAEPFLLPIALREWLPEQFPWYAIFALFLVLIGESVWMGGKGSILRSLWDGARHQIARHDCRIHACLAPHCLQPGYQVESMRGNIYRFVFL